MDSDFTNLDGDEKLLRTEPDDDGDDVMSFSALDVVEISKNGDEQIRDIISSFF